MPDSRRDVVRVRSGYKPSQAAIEGDITSIYRGQNCFILPNGLIRSARGCASIGSSGGANPLLNVDAGHGGLTGGGSLIRYLQAYFAAGNGSIILNGASIGTASGVAVIIKDGIQYVAGISAPGAPVVSNSGVAGQPDGLYGYGLTAIRSATGAESSLGEISAPISLTQDKPEIDIWPAVPSGADRWGIYSCKRGFPLDGPYYRVMDVPTTTPNNFRFDYSDSQLIRLAPRDYDPPPPCGWVFSIDSILVYAGAYGGSALCPAYPTKPEAVPPDWTVELSRGEVITCVKGSGMDGRVFIACANSFHECIRSGNTIFPIATRPIWPSTGFVSPSSWCVVFDIVYGYSSMGLVRTRGDQVPDEAWAADVQAEMSEKGFTSQNTVTQHDPYTKSIVVMKGTEAYCYSLLNDWWSTPITIPAAATAVTVNNRLMLADASGTLYQFEAGTGSNWYLIPAFRDGGLPEYLKTIIGVRARAGAPISLDVLTDEDVSTSKKNYPGLAAGHTDWLRAKIRNTSTYSVKVSGSGAAQEFTEFGIEFIPVSGGVRAA